MAEFNAYLRFNGNCRDAMLFYQKSFDGNVHLMTIGESPVKDQMPPEMHDKIMHSIMTSGSVMIMGSDMMGDKEYVHGTSMAICLVCKSKEEIERLFANLSEGGTITQPLAEMIFGMYGDLIDKYGFSWIFQYGEGQQ